MKKYIDFQKMYDKGITDLYMGGEVENDSYFSSRQVLEEDYSEPVFQGKCEILRERKLDKKFHIVVFTDEIDGSIALTNEEYNAGLVTEEV